MYASAVQTGLSTIANYANVRGSPEFANAYNNAAARFRSASAKNTAERNISAVRQDKILSNTKIKLQATQAEAMQRVQNAMAGREGGSVNDTLSEIGKSESQMIQSTEKVARQQEESLLASVNAAQGALLSVRDEKISMLGSALDMFSGFEFSDIKLTNDLIDKWAGKKKKGKK
jgi:hypothetical protein